MDRLVTRLKPQNLQKSTIDESVFLDSEVEDNDFVIEDPILKQKNLILFSKKC